MTLTNAQLKRDLLTEMDILLAKIGNISVGTVDLNEIAQAAEHLYAAFPTLSRGEFAPNPRPSWPL